MPQLDEKRDDKHIQSTSFFASQPNLFRREEDQPSQTAAAHTEDKDQEQAQKPTSLFPSGILSFGAPGLAGSA